MNEEAKALDPEAIQICFHTLMEKALPVQIICPGGLELDGKVEALQPDRNRFVALLRDLPGQWIRLGQTVEIALAYQGQRYVGISRIQLKLDNTHLVLDMPLRMSPRERRAAVRQAIRPTGSTRATLKLSMQGPLLSGPLLDLSSGGFSMLLERVMDLEGRQRLDPRQLKLEKDQAIASVEISGIRNDNIEASGLLRDLEQGPDGLILRIQFRSMMRVDRDFIAVWAMMPDTSELDEVPAPPQGGTDRRQALLKLKKKLRGLLLIQKPSPERAALVQHLAQEGYGFIRQAGTLREVADAFSGAPIHGILLCGDLEDASLEALIGFVHFARNLETGPLIVLLENQAELEEAYWKKFGADHMIWRPFTLPHLSEQLADWIGLHQTSAPTETHLLKAFKPLGMVMEPSPQRASRSTWLKASGFRHLVPMGNLVELAMAQERKPEVLWIEMEVEGIELLSLLAFLHFQQPEHPYRMVICTTDSSQALEMACQKMGGIRVLSPQASNEDFLSALDEMLTTG